MAEFKTHLTISSLGSGIASTLIFASAIATPKEVVLYFILGVIGGLLPDIDSDSSLPVRLLFTFIATLISFFVIFHQQPDRSALELFLIWMGSFVVIRYFVFSLFTKLTIHRGIIHSIPAAVLFGISTTILLHRFFQFNEFKAWMSGLFVFGGYILHLTLDEIYSLNLTGTRIKKSAGTALKFWNGNDLKTSFLVYLAIALLFTVIPEYKNFFSTIFDTATYNSLKFFPNTSRFKDFILHLPQFP